MQIIQHKQVRRVTGCTRLGKDGLGGGGTGRGGDRVGKWVSLTWARFGHKWHFLRFGGNGSDFDCSNRLSSNVGELEFVEYLNHVGLGHVPRLTRVEWGCNTEAVKLKLSGYGKSLNFVQAEGGPGETATAEGANSQPSIPAQIQAKVSSALFCLRQCNTYRVSPAVSLVKPMENLRDPGGHSSSSGYSCHAQESAGQVCDIVESSRAKGPAKWLMQLCRWASSAL
ncbi:protein ALWAYS EARLY 3-like [Pyrus ussuriensis x Pyrus communis]|uniref:Protein ALWAYS EARLY 3-like n=1 Tax=Pyrus ussuriensis x Pyrus communis TaxID=2448454 RepID=A0A5N5HEA2_9ROSA|nr:protein ALWAYS EARLY 3-like [Pyrus ussuriensis x Pyrus communis]